MKRVNRSEDALARVASRRAIARFFDSQAEFPVAATNELPAVGEPEGTIPLDARGIELGHHDGKRPSDRAAAHYRPTDPALLQRGDNVPTAAIRRPGDDVCSGGLEPVAAAYSVRSPEDWANPARPRFVSSTLYSWWRLQLAEGRR